MTENRKAWQEPMVWLMVGIPFLTVIAGFYTLYLAINSGSLDSSKVTVQRIAQAQTVENLKDTFSAEQNYYGFLIVDKSQPTWKVTLKTVPIQLRDQDIQIVFVHPQYADQDVSVVISSKQESIQLPKAFTFKPQQIVVSDVKGKWRLVGNNEDGGLIMLTPVLGNN